MDEVGVIRQRYLFHRLHDIKIPTFKGPVCRGLELSIEEERIYHSRHASFSRSLKNMEDKGLIYVWRGWVNVVISREYAKWIGNDREKLRKVVESVAHHQKSEYRKRRYFENVKLPGNTFESVEIGKLNPMILGGLPYVC